MDLDNHRGTVDASAGSGEEEGSRHDYFTLSKLASLTVRNRELESNLVRLRESIIELEQIVQGQNRALKEMVNVQRALYEGDVAKARTLLSQAIMRWATS